MKLNATGSNSSSKNAAQAEGIWLAPVPLQGAQPKLVMHELGLPPIAISQKIGRLFRVRQIDGTHLPGPKVH
jgi:hypothetical protein